MYIMSFYVYPFVSSVNYLQAAFTSGHPNTKTLSVRFLILSLSASLSITLSLSLSLSLYIYIYIYLYIYIYIVCVCVRVKRVFIVNKHPFARRLCRRHRPGICPHVRDCERGRGQVLGIQRLRAAGHRQQDGCDESGGCSG